MKSSVIDEIYSGYCIFCGRPADAEHHLLNGKGIRQLAESDGIKVPVCNSCHNMGKVTERIHDNVMAEKLSKMFGQAIWERNEVAKGVSIDEAKSKFRARYGRSYF